MDSFLSGLTKRQSMLLLTAVTFGGQEGVEAFEHLPDDEGDVLRDRAAKILAVPREQRIPFLVGEIKRFIASRNADQLRAADPQRVADALAKERPAIKEVVLRALPSSLARDVRDALVQPVVELKKEIRPDLLAVIRWRFEQQLAELMPQRSSFAITDLVLVPSRDLGTLCDVLGARALAPLVAALPTPERDALLSALAPDQRQLVTRAFSAGASLRRTDPVVARRQIEEASADGGPRGAMRQMGIRRLARACLSQSAELARRIVEGHRDEFGARLGEALDLEEREAKRPDDSAKQEVLSELEKLATRGVIDRPVRLPPPARKPAPQRLGPPPGAGAAVPPAKVVMPPPRPSLASRPAVQSPAAKPAPSPTPPRSVPGANSSASPRPATAPPPVQRGGAANPSTSGGAKPPAARPGPVRGPSKS